MDNKVQRRDRCYHSMLWIFDEIRKFMRSNSNNINLLDVLNKFHYVEERIIEDINRTSDENKYLCRSYFIYHDLEEWKNVKYLNDYIKNYEKIKQNVISSTTNCEKYRKYFEFIKILYERHKEECCEYWNTECHKYFSCDPFYDPNNLLPALENCKNVKFNLISSAEVKSLSKDSTKPFNMEVKNVRCVAYKYEDYGFLSCFDSPLTHNVTIKGIPKKLYPIKKDEGKKNNQMRTTDVIMGMQNSMCNITRKENNIVELSCRKISSNESVNKVDGQIRELNKMPKDVHTGVKINNPDETLIWKGLKHSKEEACTTDLLGFCVDPKIINKNNAREEK
ncbi:CYIR protein [Plasmodium cynomolgi strain B]|uniref:CYIR protein n=1 Tax=Plasmodium cynomolgi (strain B) TaxID=1120755 RepID=K6V2S3_PLACD|nr:CYIR protein [Plasmodium cynomolgi strain B]GAB69585.1 CYIR protein [Plasmodium cynomolgi strain B]